MTAEEGSIAVLYVNDEPDLLDLLAGGLERESDRITVETAESVDDGLAHLRDHAVDCVISDYSMPGATGVDFLRTVRESQPELPFVMFAETGSERVASEAISAGVTDYVIERAIGTQHELLARKIATYVDSRRAERRASRTNRRLRELAAVSDDVLWTFSADWSELLFINEAHELLFGQPNADLYDDPGSFLDRIHEEDRSRVRLAMKRATEGDPQSVEYRVQQSESIEVWVESHCEPIRGDDGEVLRVTGFTRETTDRKMRERELATTNDQLDRFVSTVAHDLRNPISIADGHLGLAREEFDSSHLGAAARAVERMDELVGDLLRLARTGTAVGDTDPVEFADVIRSAGNNVAMADATLAVERTCTIECDGTRLKEAVENLLRNAIEHNEAAVTVTAGILSDGEGFYVQDDGDGIPAAHYDEVFDDGYTTLQKGTGFGLSIVSRVVDAHDWTIGAMESPTGGARFEVTGVECMDRPRSPATADD